MSAIAKKSIETFLARSIIQIFAVAGGIVIARELGASGKGIFTYAMTIVATIQVVYAGQSAAISWQYGRRGFAAGPVFAAAMRIFAYSAIPLTIAVAAVAALVPDQRVLYFAAAALPFALFVQISSGFFLADSDVRGVNIQQAIPVAGATVLYVPLLILAHAPLVTVLAAWAFCWGAAALYSLVKMREYAGKGREPEGGTSGIMRGQIAYAAQISANSVISYLNFRIDVFIVLFMLGQGALGIYSIGIAVGELMFQITRPLVTSAFGRIVRSEERESAILTAKCMRHSFALVLLVSIVAFFAAPPLIAIVYGSQFASAGPVVRFLLPGVIAYSMMPVLATFFSQQLGNPRIPLVLSAISTILCAIITAATLRHVGIVGGAVATSASYLTAFVLAIAYFLRRTKLPLADLFVLSNEDIQIYRRLVVRALELPAAFSGRLHRRGS